VKAAVYDRYGPPEVIRIADVEMPTPAESEVLVRVHAASVNPLDCAKPRGGGRVVTGLLKPTDTRLGIDLAGEVEAVGRSVTHFKPGDKIFGVCIKNPGHTGIRAWTCQGSYAEYVCAPESMVTLKPDNVTFAQAASVPVASFTALQALRDKGHIQSGQCVLINGAAGGVGTFAVQIAKAFGARVTGICSTRNLDIVRSIGADRVIDYTHESFKTAGQPYDMILDCVGNHSPADCIRALTPSGAYIMVGDLTGRGAIQILARLSSAFVMSRLASRRAVMFLAKPAAQDLITIRDLMRAEKVRPVIDRHYALNEVSDAFRYVEGRHARGKVVITLVPGAE
jgi:NADPH:quinone reductase-like Zn-dependent oxidoreductase